MQLITGATSLFLILQLAMVGRAAPPADVIYHCAWYISLQLHELIHLLKGNKWVSLSDKYLCPYLKRKGISQHKCRFFVAHSLFITSNSLIQAHLNIYVAAPLNMASECNYMPTSKFTLSFYQSLDFSCRAGGLLCPSK